MSKNQTTNTSNITVNTVKHIANLAQIPVSDAEAEKLQHAFEETLKTVAELKEVDVSNVEPTHQVTGLTNVLRQDVVNPDNMFTQEQALKNAKKTYQGFFVVPRIIEEK